MIALLVNDQQPGSIRVIPDYPRPVPAAGETLIRVRYAGVCSTDLEIARGYMGFVGVPGHEFVGGVEEGPVALRGKRVVADINCVCHHCDMCNRGFERHCRNRTVVGILGRDGAFAEFLAVPAENCHVVPDEIDDRSAVFTEPLAAAAHVLDEADFTPQTRVAVIGLGRLGLLVAQVLHTTDCDLRAIGRNPRTRALCRNWGIAAFDTDAEFPAEHDVVVDCTGSPAGLRRALELVRPRGTIVLKSTYAAPEPLQLAPIVIDEIRLVGSRCGDFPRALRLLAERRIDVTSLISAEFPLSRAAEAMAAAADGANRKVLLSAM